MVSLSPGLLRGASALHWNETQNTCRTEVERGRASVLPKAASSEVSVGPPSQQLPLPGSPKFRSSRHGGAVSLSSIIIVIMCIQITW